MLRFASREEEASLLFPLAQCRPYISAAACTQQQQQPRKRTCIKRQATYKRRTTCVSRSEQRGMRPVATTTTTIGHEHSYPFPPSRAGDLHPAESSKICLLYLLFLPQHLPRRKGTGRDSADYHPSTTARRPPPPPRLDVPCSLVTSPDLVGEGLPLPSFFPSSFHPALQGGCNMDASAGGHVKAEK